MKNENIERRYFAFAPTLEVREEGGKKTIQGYALKFNVLSRMLAWGFREKIDPRALDNTDFSDVIATFNHNLSKLLGRSNDKVSTLTLEKREEGLYYKIQPPASGSGPEAVESIERGDVDGSSFIFEINTRGDSWITDDDGIEIRTILDIRKIFEVSPVIFPAYKETEAKVAKRSYDEYKAGQEEEEEEKKEDKEQQEEETREEPPEEKPNDLDSFVREYEYLTIR